MPEIFLENLIDEVGKLFNSRKSFNSPRVESPPTPIDNSRNYAGEFYRAPLQGDWKNSGGFTYTPNATHPQGHMGIDMRSAGGTAVYPLSAGVVSSVGTDPKGGNVVNINHANGVRSYYAHLATVSAHKGDKVSPDTPIGTVGSTGNASHSFPHLHFQVWKDNRIQDPAQFFSVPKYTDLSPQEKKQGPWLSEKAKQDAQAFRMKEHLSQRRAAFTREVNKLVKLADNYFRLVK